MPNSLFIPAPTLSDVEFSPTLFVVNSDDNSITINVPDRANSQAFTVQAQDMQAIVDAIYTAISNRDPSSAPGVTVKAVAQPLPPQPAPIDDSASTPVFNPMQQVKP